MGVAVDSDDENYDHEDDNFDEGDEGKLCPSCPSGVQAARSFPFSISD